MNDMTLIETLMHLMIIGALMFFGFVGGNGLVEFIDDRAKQAAKRENQNQGDDSK